jgi:SOS-response transcriptional repressor LexA
MPKPVLADLLSWMNVMTEKQAYIYDIINKWWIKHGFAPSIDDIMDITGDKGRGNVHRTMKRLVELGHCKMLPRRARSIRPSYLRVNKLDAE